MDEAPKDSAFVRSCRLLSAVRATFETGSVKTTETGIAASLPGTPASKLHSTVVALVNVAVPDTPSIEQATSLPAGKFVPVI